MKRRIDTKRARAARTPIEDVDCGLLDLVLAVTFDRGELENLLSGAGLEHQGCRCHPGRSPIAHTHHAAHAGGPFARRLEGLLDVVQGSALARLERGDDLDEVLGDLSDLGGRADLAALAWAVCRSTRDDVEVLRPRFARALAIDAARALAARVAR